MKLKITLTTFLLVVTASTLKAQRTPNVQKDGVRAPLGFKIDGKAQEWNDILKAHNSATDITYTMANDDDKLYLTIQATNHSVINKILGGGVVLTIDTTGKKDIKNGISITYPVLELQNRVWVDVNNKPVIVTSSSSSVTQADSFMNANNKRFIERSKVIRVTGMKGVDTLISIYNRNGIRAAALFNNLMIYTYELAIELKQLGLNFNKREKFAYNVRLPGVDMIAVYAASGIRAFVEPHSGYVISTGGRLPGFTQEYLDNHPASFPPKVYQSIFINSSDFWGEYQLIK